MDIDDGVCSGSAPHAVIVPEHSRQRSKARVDVFILIEAFIVSLVQVLKSMWCESMRHTLA